MKSTKKFLGRWREFLIEGWAEDIKAAIERNRDTDRSELMKVFARTKRAKGTFAPDEATWDQFKQELEKEKGREKEIAWKKHEATTVLERNVDMLLNDPFILSSAGGLFFHYGNYYADPHKNKPGVEEYREEVKAEVEKAIKKDKKNPLNTSKVKKYLGNGAYGIIFELSNGHVIKLFSDGMYGVKEDLKWYKEMQDRQFDKQSEPGELAVYAFGLIENPHKWGDSVAYAEIGKVIPFEAWLALTDKEEAVDGVMQFNDIHDWLADRAQQPGSNVDGEGNPLILPVTKLQEDEYISHIMGALEANIPEWLPEESGSVWNKGVLRDILRAVYRLARRSGDQYLFQRKTADIHAGNFGFSLETNRVVVFDK